MAEIKKPAASEMGHQVTGKVAILYGTVKAISPDGTVRMLKINSPVFADDRIITGDDGSVSIVFDTFNHTQLDLGRMSNVVIDEDVYGVVSHDVAAEASAEQESIQKALLAGDQPLVLEATAAGAEANAGGGHPVFVVTPDWVHVTPESGAETRGITWGFENANTFDPNLEQPINHPPTITVDPGNVQGDNDVVHESGLATGSNAAANTEFAYGTFTVSDPDGLGDIQSVTINGTTIAIGSLAGTVIHGANGDLTVTAYNGTTGVADYTYELKTPTTDGAGTETNVFTLTTSDGTATSAPATITIEIVDDVPHAVADTNSIAEDTTTAITGNVLTNDVSGADTPASFVGWATTTATYGHFTDTGNGTYSYTLDNANPLVQGLDTGETLQETFNYTMQDADGDQDTATLTITINGTNDTPHITTDPGNVEGGNDVVYESGLASGSNAAAPTEFAYGTFTVSDPDGLDDIQSVTINGTTIAIGSLAGTVIHGANGDLTVTAYNGTTGVADYTYELKTPTTDLAGTETNVFTLTTSDGTATSAPATITIEIVDDVPHAVADTNSIAEDTTTAITGNVLTNDLHPNGQPGADTPTSFVSWASTTATYGHFTDTGNGTYSYTLDNANPLVQGLDTGETLQETFNYTMQDADGDQDTATLTITINGTNDTPHITTDPGNVEGGNDVVYESGLASGSNAAAPTEFAYGTFTVSDPDGLDDIQSVTINGTTIAIGSLAGTVIHGANGDLTVTAYNGTTGVADYTYELKTPTTDLAGTETNVFTLTTSDGTATSAPATITIDIVDDVPNAMADTNSIAEDVTTAITGNVLTNDLHPNGQPGADTPTSFVSWASTTATYGHFTDTGNGTYSYTLDNANPLVQSLDTGETLQETFTYTMQDADGDQDTATLTITINGTNDTPHITTDPGNVEGGNDVVYESGLASGSNAAAPTEFAYGTFTVSDPDGLDDIQSVTINGTTIAIGSLAGTVIHGANGDLTVTAYNGTTGVADYTYELKTPTTDLAGTETNVFTLTTSDGTSTSAPATITIEIVDDVPTALADGPYNVTEDATSHINGNVLTNDISGADTPATFSAWGATSADAAAIADLAKYGTLTLNGDGTWSFDLNNSLPAVQALIKGQVISDSINYTMHDADGDTSSSTLTIKINGADDSAHVTVDASGTDVTVYEHGLTSVPDTSETSGNTFSVSATDGINTVVVEGHSFNLTQLQGFTPGSPSIGINTGEGTLYLTGYTGSATGGAVSYSYTLNAALTHDQPAHDTTLTDSVSVTVNGASGTTDTANLTVHIIDDIPTLTVAADSLTVDEDGLAGHAVDGTPLHAGEVTSTGSASATGNLADNFNFGADGPAAAAIYSVNGVTATAGHILISTAAYNLDVTAATGAYTFTLTDNLIHNPVQGENLQTLLANGIGLDVVAQDADGDQVHGTVTLNVTVADDIPTLTVAADSLTVDEDGLAGHAVDGTPLHAGEVTGTGSASATGNLADNFNFGADGPAAAAIYSVNGVTATSGHILISTASYNLDVTAATGAYTFTLTDNLIHNPVQGENLQALLANGIGLNVVAQDADGDKVSGTVTLNVNVLDDMPVAGDQSMTVGAGHSVGTNLLLVIDTTGSMGDNPGVSGYSTKLALEKAALDQLITEYGTHGDVMVRLVTFHDGTSEIVGSGWMTASQAIATINGLTASGTTNYDAALLNAQTAFNTAGAISGAQNVSYFLSDGVPNVSTTWPGVSGSGANGINAAEQTAWETFLHTHNITSFSLGLGSGTTVSTLDPIAYDGVHGTQMPTDASGHDGIVINDLSQLSTVLLGTVIVPDNIAGNLISGSVPVSFGADGPAVLKIVSIAHDVNGDGTDEVYNTSSAGYNAATTTLTLTTQEGGTLAVNFSTGDYTYSSPTTPALGTNEVFKYTVMDGDGDTASATLTVNLPVHDMLVAGTNVNDQTGQTIDHYIDHNAPLHGPITGGGGNDILVGDIGGYAKGAGATANLVFVLDRSGSMGTETIPFGTGDITRLQALKNSMTDALNDLYNSGAENVRVHLVSFSNTASDLGTFNLTVNGVDNATALANAIAAVNGLTSNGTTNYEAALQMAHTWLGTSSNILASADVNEVIFISDGAPNTPNSNASQYTDDANNILSHGFTIDAVGINVDTNALAYLDKVEGSTAASGSADNIHTAEELTAVIGHLAGGDIILNTAGNDNIVAGDGNDIVFGDALNTDALADAKGLTTANGASWAVFQQLGWTEQQITDYIKINHLSLSTESGRAGGNDTIDGGAGNDTIYGQEGNDILSGGAGNDILSGGTGNNILKGGTGADTFVLSNGGKDTIQDYNKGQLDKVDISAVLDIADETAAKSYMSFHNNADGKAVLEVYNSSTDHSAGHLVGSVTFDNITDATSLDSLLGKVDIDHTT